MKIKAYRLNDNTWLLVDPVGDEGQATVTAKDERGIKAQLADVAVITYGWHRPEIVLMSGRPPLNAARNAAGYVDASSVVLHPGDAVVFKTGYRSHSNDDEWLERNGDTVREVRGDEVKIGPSANDWAKIKDLMVWHNAARSRNAVVQKALNARAVARNADFKVGDVVGLKIMDGGRRDYVIYEVLPDSYRLCYADNFGAGCERVRKWPSDEFVDKHRRIKVPLNATARNGAMAALDSSEKSKIKSIASGMPCSFMDGGDSLSGVIKHPKRPFLYIDFDVSKSEIDGKPYYEWYVHAWNRTRKWERNGGQYKIEDAVSAADQAMRGAKQMIEKWAGGVPLNADTSVLRETAVNGSDDAILRLCKPSNVIQRGKTENLHEVRYGGGYIYPVVSRDGVLTKVYGSLSEANRRTLNAASKTAVNANATRVFRPGEKVAWEYLDGDGDSGTVVADKGSFVEVKLQDGGIAKPAKAIIVTNAKFNVGDAVKICNPHIEYRGRHGKVVETSVDGNPLIYKVDLGGLWEEFSESDLIAANASRTTNAIVAKALNACSVRNGYVVLRTASGGTGRVYEGEEVEFDGKTYTAKALGSPQLDKATLVDGAGNKIVVQLRDTRLKAKNACRVARNGVFLPGQKVELVRDISPTPMFGKAAPKGRKRGEAGTVVGSIPRMAASDGTYPVQVAFADGSRHMVRSDSLRYVG